MDAGTTDEEEEFFVKRTAIELRDAILELYLNVKIRSSKEVSYKFFPFPPFFICSSIYFQIDNYTDE
jgi:hypothetical protein